MTFTTFCLIAIAISVILIAEIIIACVLCAKLCKHRARLKEEQSKHKTNLHSFLLLTAASMYQTPLVVIFVILAAEIIFFTWLNVSLVKMLKATEEEEKEEDIALAATMVRHSISLEEAHNALSDEAALHLIEEEPEEEVVAAAGAKHLWVHRRYKNKTIINVDTLSEKFSDNDHVNLHTLKAKKLIHANVDYVKVLGRGVLDKRLYVEAHAFSADAVKMIVLTGGHAIKFVHDKHHHHTHHK